MPGYHVHIDAEQLDAAFEAYLTGPMAFWRSDFTHEIEPHEGYEPAHHLTRKPPTSVEFRGVFAELVDYVTRHPSAMRGYIEGEFIAIDDDFETGAFDATVPMPFALTMTSLAPGTFRESEVHISLNREASDPRLRQNLHRMGFFSGFIKKPSGVFQILTAQGSRVKIERIVPALRDYLTRAGGAVNCSIKEERVAQWWMSEPGLRLPPVIDRVQAPADRGAR